MYSGVSVVLGKYLPLDIEQELASRTVIPHGRGHALQNTEDKEVDSFVMKLVSDATKLGNSVLQAFLDGRGSVLSGAFTEQFAKIGEVLVDCPVVIPRAFLERQHRWRRRLLERFVQQALSLMCIKGWLPANVDAPPIGNAENFQRLDRIRRNFPSEEFSECHIQCARDSQIHRKHRQFIAGSPLVHRGWTDSQYSRNTGETLGIGGSAKQTRELCSAQQGGRIKCSTDQIFYLIGHPYFPIRRFRRKKRIGNILSPDHPFDTKPFLAARAISYRATLAQERLWFSTEGADQLKWTVVVRAVLHDFQRPKQRHVYVLPAVAPAVQALRAPTRNATGQQLCGQNRFPGKHGEVVEIRPSSEVSHHGRETRCDAANAVDGGSEAACSGGDGAGEHVSVSSFKRKKFAMIQSAGRYRVRFCESRKVARQALHESCSEADRIEIVEPASRRKLYIAQIPGSIFDRLFSWHVGLHD